MENSEYVKREVDARAKDETEARALLDRAADEKRDLSPEEEEQFDRLIASSGKHKDRIDKLTRMSETAVIGTEARSIAEGATAIEATAETFDSQLVGAIRSAFGDHSDEKREIAFEAPAGKAPFGRWAIDQMEIRALESMPGITGRTADFLTQVAVYARTLSPWIGLATVINGTNGAPIQLPRLTADVTTYTPGQGTAITESTPVVTAATATPSSYKGLSYISQEEAEDDEIGLTNLISRDHGRAIGLAFGVVTTAAALAGFSNGGTATLGTPFFGLDDILGLIYGRAVPYRQGGVFVAATGAVLKMRRFKDNNGQYLWQPSQQAGEPDRLLGYAVYEDPALATPASATKSVLFGQASEYVIKQLPMRVAVSTDFKFDTDQVAIKSVYRAGGAVRLSDAMAYLVSSNT